MRAYEIQRGIGIEGLAAVERPEPRAQHGQVLVRIRATSLNYRDLMMVRGYFGALRVPLVPLSDGAGEVVEVGPGVTRVKPGDRVMGTFFQSWISGPIGRNVMRCALGGGIDGVLAEVVALREDGVIPIPAHLSWEEAATLPCAALTAWQALVTRGGLSAGDTVVVLGTGGVSVFALQFAKLHGARAIVTSSSDAKLARARALGADETINYRTTPDWDERVIELTGGQGADHIVEIGGGTLPRSLNAAAPHGNVAIVGGLAGPPEGVNLREILLKELNVRGIVVGSCEMFQAMNRAIAQHQLRPAIDRVFGFDQTVDAYRHLESGAHFGKVVVTI
ncbi:MAG: NAD(P)-dependent alcohol dehydrogenase [Candidatus Binatia bacterium]